MSRFALLSLACFILVASDRHTAPKAYSIAPPGQLPRDTPFGKLDRSEALDRTYLESSRRYLAFLKEQAAWQEELLRELPEANSHRLYALLSSLREDVKKQEKWVHALDQFDKQKKAGFERDALKQLNKTYMDLWPEPQVAPMPREVKSSR